MIFIREASARSPEVTFRRVGAGQRGVSISRWFLCMQIGAGPDRLLEDAFTHRGDAGRDVDVCTRSRSPSAADPLRGLDGTRRSRRGPAPDPRWVRSGSRVAPGVNPGAVPGAAPVAGVAPVAVAAPASAPRRPTGRPPRTRMRTGRGPPPSARFTPSPTRSGLGSPSGGLPPSPREPPSTHSGNLLTTDPGHPLPTHPGGPLATRAGARSGSAPPEAARTRPRRGADAARTWRGRGPGTVRTRSGRGANATPAAIPPQSVRGSHTGRGDRGDRSVTSATSAAGAQEEGLANRFNRW